MGQEENAPDAPDNGHVFANPLRVPLLTHSSPPTASSSTPPQASSATSPMRVIFIIIAWMVSASARLNCGPEVFSTRACGGCASRFPTQ